MTPIELYDNIYVKRDDLCFSEPAPPFSKCRGILEHFKKLKASGITTVGYVETSISMAGWGVAWACYELQMTPVIFNPLYKNTPDILTYHRQQWKKFHPIIIDIPAGMAKVNWYICKKYMKQYSNSILLPLGLPFMETIEETKKEIEETFNKIDKKIKTVVSCVGSGTIIAGIWKGLIKLNLDISLYGVMTRSGNIDQKLKTISHKANILQTNFFNSSIPLQLINPGWEYTEKSIYECPFPCHPYYDLKAWQWLKENEKMLKAPILFWNIGH